MGFFSSLIDGAKSAGQWVINHSGQISEAVGVVAKVATLIPVAEGMEAEAFIAHDTKTHVDKFAANFAKATALLEQEAKTAADTADTEKLEIHCGDQPTVTSDTVSGIVTQPATTETTSVTGSRGSDAEPYAPLVLYEDLSKFLGQMGVPGVVGTKTITDVTAQLGLGLFAKPTITDRSNLASPVNTIASTIIDREKQWTLVVAHAHYAIPMGEAGKKDAWHSAFHAKFTRTGTGQKALELSGTNRAQVHELPSEPGWLTTFQLDWTQASLANRSQTGLVRSFEDRKDGKRIYFSQLHGTYQTLKIYCPLASTPTQALAAVSQAASAAIKEEIGETSSKGVATNYPAVAPNIRLVNSSYTIPSNASNNTSNKGSNNQTNGRFQVE